MSWLDKVGAWSRGMTTADNLLEAGKASAYIPGFQGVAATAFVVDEYRDNERRKREALRQGNREAYDALVARGEKIGAQLDAQEKADIDREQKALAEWDQFVELGKQGELDMKAFRADPTAYIKKRTNFEGTQKVMVEGMDKSAAARGDLLGSEQQARIARGTADLLTLKQQEALDNIYSLLDLGRMAKGARGEITSEFDRARRARDDARRGLEAKLGDAEAAYNTTNRAIAAKRYEDANALTMNMINNAANLGLGAATLAAGLPPTASPSVALTPAQQAPVTQPVAAYNAVPTQGQPGAPGFQIDNAWWRA